MLVVAVLNERSRRDTSGQRGWNANKMGPMRRRNHGLVQHAGANAFDVPQTRIYLS